MKNMIKREVIRFTLQKGESLNRENFKERTCLIVIKGSFMVFNDEGKLVFRLNAGEANVVSGHYELTGTAMEDDTLIMIV